MYMQRRAETEIQSKLAANDKTLEETKMQMRSLKDMNDLMNEQLDKTLHYQQSKIDETRKRTDELSVKLYDYATKKDMRMLEERLNASFDAKIANALKGLSEKMGESKKSMLEDRKEVDGELLDLKRKIIELEKQYESKLTTHQNSTGQEIRELGVENKKALKQMQDAMNKFNEQIYKQLENNKKAVMNETKQQMNTQFLEFKAVIAYLQKKVKEDNAAIKQYGKERTKEQKWVEQRDKELEQERSSLEKRIESLRERADLGLEEEKLQLQSQIVEHSKKEKTYELKLTGVAQLQDELMNAMEEVKERMNALEVNKSQDVVVKERRKNPNESSVHDSLMEKNREQRDQLSEQNGKLAVLEESLDAIKTQLREDEKKLDTSMRAVKAIATNNENIEQELEDIKKRLSKLNKQSEIPEEIESLDNATKELKQSYKKLHGSHEQLSDSVRTLEDKVNELRTDLNRKLRNCNEELEAQQDALQRLTRTTRDQMLISERAIPREEIKVRAIDPHRGASSKPYTAEEPILLRQGIRKPTALSKSISENYLRQKFTVNLRDLSRVGQETSSGPVHYETVGYNDVYLGERKLAGREGGVGNSSHIERIAEPLADVVESRKEELVRISSEDEAPKDSQVVGGGSEVSKTEKEVSHTEPNNVEQPAVKIQEESELSDPLDDVIGDYLHEKEDFSNGRRSEAEAEQEKPKEDVEVKIEEDSVEAEFKDAVENYKSAERSSRDAERKSENVEKDAQNVEEDFMYSKEDGNSARKDDSDFSEDGNNAAGENNNAKGNATNVKEDDKSIGGGSGNAGEDKKKAEEESEGENVDDVRKGIAEAIDLDDSEDASKDNEYFISKKPDKNEDVFVKSEGYFCTIPGSTEAKQEQDGSLEGRSAAKDEYEDVAEDFEFA